MCTLNALLIESCEQSTSTLYFQVSNFSMSARKVITMYLHGNNPFCKPMWGRFGPLYYALSTTLHCFSYELFAFTITCPKAIKQMKLKAPLRERVLAWVVQLRQNCHNVQAGRVRQVQLQVKNNSYTLQVCTYRLWWPQTHLTPRMLWP